MRLPQVSERVKEAPAQALRGVFAGIGQLLLITDKLRNKAPAHADIPRVSAEPSRAPSTPQAAEPSPAPEPSPASGPSAAGEQAASEQAAAGEQAAGEPGKDFGKTGNVRLLTGETSAPTAEPVPATEPATAGKPAGEPVPVPAGEPVPVPVGEAVPAAVVAEPAGAGEPGVEGAAEIGDNGAAGGVAPLPNYDALTIASLRARLRNLTVEQVRELAEYERAHAARPEVITMFERRVAKLEAGA